jgi:hypothetical protein
VAQEQRAEDSHGEEFDFREGARRSVDEDQRTDLRETLITIAIESWRLSRLFQRVLGKLDVGDAQRYANQGRYLLQKMDDCLKAADVRIVSIEGQTYDPGVAASALNLSDFGPEDSLVVDQMVEPIVMGRSGLIRSGTVMLRRVN